MTRQTNDTHVVRHVLTAELRSQTDLIRLLQQPFLQLYIAERTAGLVARRRQTVVVMRARQLNRQQVLLRTRTANDDRDMIRWTRCGTEALHLLHQERDQRTRVLDTRFRLLIQIGLVRTTATFGHAQKTVLISFRSLEVDLCRQVTFGVHLVVHVQRCVLAVTQVALGIGIIHTLAECFLIAEPCPHFLPFLAVDNSRSGILAER